MSSTNGQAVLPRLVIPDDVTGAYANAAATARLRTIATVEIHTTRAADEAELKHRIADAEIVLSFRPAFTRFPATVLGACKRLRMICISGTGVEDVDVAEASARGIAVANVVGSGDRAVAELALAMMFDVARQVSAQDRAIRGGTWQAREGIELGGKTLGIVGLSAIARDLAPMAAGIGMRVVSWSRNNDPARAGAAQATAVPLDELLGAADFVSLHLRLFPELVGFFGAKQFAAMKPGAFLINTARGELVDETALVAALASGRLRGAGLDVFQKQPLPADHPLRAMANVVLTPASGWNTSDASRRMIGQSIDNILAFVAGKPINVVNLAALNRTKS